MAWDSIVFGMDPGELVLVLFACCFGALLVGAVGVGGVVILPALIVAGVDPAVGIVTVFTAFAPVVLIKLILMARINGLVPWRAALSSGASAAVGAAVGGVLVDQAPHHGLTFLVGAVALLAGLSDAVALAIKFRRNRREKRDEQKMARDGERLTSFEQGAAEQTDAERETEGRRANLHSEALQEDSEKGEDTAGLMVEAALDAVDSEGTPDGAPEPAAAAFSLLLPKADEVQPTQKPSNYGLCLDRIFSIRTKDTHLRRVSLSNADLQVEGWEATNFEMAVMFVLGLVTGLVSVLTGTGGPLMMLPMLLVWKGSNLNRKVMLASTSVLSVSLSCMAVISTVADGLRPDGLLSLIVGVCGVAGVFLGVRVLELASRELLQGVMAIVLLAIAALTITQAARHEP